MSSQLLTDSQFLSWLLVMGFLTETPYPKPGDFILQFKDGTFSYFGILTKEGLEENPEESLHFFFALLEENIARLHERLSV